jgi:hypothetical protein
MQRDVYTARESKETNHMTRWMSRFALLTAVAGILSSALVMGCGGGEEAETTTTTTDANGATNQATTTTTTDD